MKILTYPNPGLRQKPIHVTKEIRESKDFKDAVLELYNLSKNDGLGVAFMQTGIAWNAFVTCVDTNLVKVESPQVFINPKITEESKEVVSETEGCLSFPGLSIKISRPSTIKWQYEDMEGNTHEATEIYSKTQSGYYIRLIQHEEAHTKGVLMTDNLPPSQQLVFNKWLKLRSN